MSTTAPSPTILELMLLAWSDLGHSTVPALDLATSLATRPTILNHVEGDAIPEAWRKTLATFLVMEGTEAGLAEQMALLHPGWRTRMLIQRVASEPAHARD